MSAVVLLSACAGAVDGTTAADQPAGKPTATEGVNHPSPGLPSATDPAPRQPTSRPSSATDPAPREPTTQPPPATATEAGVSIAFVGDVMLGRSVGDRILAGHDPFAGVAAELSAADLVIGTLETTVGEGGEPEDKPFTFQAPPEAIDSLLASHFDLVALANNHSYDYGAEGLRRTLELLDEAGLEHVGAGPDADAARAPVVLTEGGVETAFLSYVDVPDDWTGYRNRDWAATETRPGVAWAYPPDIAADVAEVHRQVDHVVVLLHAGVEGSTQPSDVQHAAAEAALEAGATAVIGAHPHVLQGYRHEDGRLTAWSLGNFVFDGFTDPDTTRSVVLTVQLTEDDITDVTWTPVQLVDGLPVTLDPDSDRGRSVLDHLESLPSQR